MLHFQLFFPKLSLSQDSIIFRYPKFAPIPTGIKLGSHMGDFEAEKCSEKIFRFVSTGAKVSIKYQRKLRHKLEIFIQSYTLCWRDDDGNVHEEIKCKVG